MNKPRSIRSGARAARPFLLYGCGIALLVAASGALLSARADGGRLARAAAPIEFDTPVRLPTFQSCGGYEPGMAIDRFGNIFVTAHKQNHCDGVADDPAATDGVRAQSWMWTSSDGVTFFDMPGLTALAADQLDVGDEGDIALDDANHFYFVDTKVADDSFARWTVTGPGTANMTLDIHRPVIPTLMPVDDRPWVTAHGAGTVMYAGNVGDKDSYNVGATSAGCTGTVTPPPKGAPASGGRFTIFMSHDAGNTFDPAGCTLPDSGWCRPAADHTAGSKYLYMFCSNDSAADDEINNQGDAGFTDGTLWSFVSADDGATWKRYKAGSYTSFSGATTNDFNWPAVTVASNGDVYALYSAPISKDGVKTGDTLDLYHSADHGQTWSKQDVTPAGAGLIRDAWMDVADDGVTIGVGYFDHPKLDQSWHVYAGVSPGFGQPVEYAPVDPTEIAPGGDFVFGDFFEVAFDRAGRLNVVYTRCTDLIPGNSTTDCLNSDVYFARTKASAVGGDLPPIAQLSAMPSSGAAPLTVTLDASASRDPDAGDSIASYSFDFGDGSAGVTQAGATVQHTYAQAGSYSAAVTATDSHGQSGNAAAVAIIVGAPGSSGTAGSSARFGGALVLSLLLPLFGLAALRRRR